MKNLTTYLFVFFMAIFWVFRIIVAFCYNLGIDFITAPMNLPFEIIILFLTFVAMILVVKRNTLGGIIYLIGNGLYFGANIIVLIGGISSGDANVNYADFAFDLIGIILPLLVFFDLILDQSRKAHPVDKKTDWFYKNEDFDRKYDERADRNQYKF